MNRREFLKLLGAGGAAIALPVLLARPAVEQRRRHYDFEHSDPVLGVVTSEYTRDEIEPIGYTYADVADGIKRVFRKRLCVPLDRRLGHQEARVLAFGVGRLRIPGGFGPKACYMARHAYLLKVVAQWQESGRVMPWRIVYLDHLADHYHQTTAEEVLRIASLE